MAQMEMALLTSPKRALKLLGSEHPPWLQQGAEYHVQAKVSGISLLHVPPPAAHPTVLRQCLVVGAYGKAFLEAGLAVAPPPPLTHTAAVWPPFCEAANCPRRLLTNIISVGIYISLTTLSQNGIKSNTSDK